MEANVRPESPGAIKNDAATRSDEALHHACLRNPNRREQAPHRPLRRRSKACRAHVLPPGEDQNSNTPRFYRYGRKDDVANLHL